MVHALKEIWRALVPDGFLIDMRPFNEKPPMEVISGDETYFAGPIDWSPDYPDDLAANAAVEQVAAEGWFEREKNASFDLLTYWDTAAEIIDFFENRTTATLPPVTFAQAEHLLAEHGPAARIRTRYNMIITRYDKRPRDL